MCLEFLDASFFHCAASIIERDNETNICVCWPLYISSTAELCLHLEERNQTHIIQSTKHKAIAKLCKLFSRANAFGYV